MRTCSSESLQNKQEGHVKETREAVAGGVAEVVSLHICNLHVFSNLHLIECIVKIDCRFSLPFLMICEVEFSDTKVW